jgi:hypothetical protein
MAKLLASLGFGLDDGDLRLERRVESLHARRRRWHGRQRLQIALLPRQGSSGKKE